MITFLVPDMSCGGCANAIMRAMQKLDPQAVVTPDLGAKRVAIETSATTAEIQEALLKAGFPASPQ
ncbi:MAG: heavy-metal-associated domain-containing protein [Rhabdaerophilum sp.]